MNIICANCEHRTERKAEMEKHFSRLGFNHSFLTATYWRDYESLDAMIRDTGGMAAEILKAGASYLTELNIAALIATWSRGMEKIIELGNPTIFCVDDMRPTFHTSHFDEMAQRVRPWDVISFWVHTPVDGKRHRTKFHKQYPELMRGVGGAGDNALMVNPNGAAKLLTWLYECPANITESMLRHKATLHQQMGYIDPNHYWIDYTKTKWFEFTEHFNESDTGLTQGAS